MKPQLYSSILTGALLLQIAVPAQARDLSTVWDIKQRCFRTATSKDCGNSYNVTTRTFVSAAGQKAEATRDNIRPTEAAPVAGPIMPSQALRELAEKRVTEEAASTKEAGEKTPSAEKPSPSARANTKAPATQDEWDVASPAKGKDEAKAGAKAAGKSEETIERSRGIRKSKANS